jgi:hypothetical protein
MWHTCIQQGAAANIYNMALAAERTHSVAFLILKMRHGNEVA